VGSVSFLITTPSFFAQQRSTKEPQT